MKLHHLRNLVAIAERGSLRAAARQLGLAQPAMSRSITELEKELGVKLFERGKSGMVLTAVGELLVRRARGIEAEFARALSEVEQFRGDGAGVLSVAFSTATLLSIFPSIIEPFRRAFPKVRLKISEGLFPVLEAQLRDGVVDLFFGPVPDHFSDPALILAPLFENRRIIVARRDHPLAGATTIRELADAVWVTTAVAVDSEKEVESLYAAAGLPTPRIVMQAGSGLSLLAAVMSSDLVAPLPLPWLGYTNPVFPIVRIPVKGIPDGPAICAVRRATLPLTPAAELFNDLAARSAAIHQAKLLPH